MILDKDGIFNELKFKAVRSSGSGGQHVNKVATKIELTFDISLSNYLSEEQKQKLYKKYAFKLTKARILILTSGETRSQLRNKQIVTERLFQLLEAGIKTDKKRKATKVPMAAKRKRLEDKRRHSDKKANRKSPRLD